MTGQNNHLHFPATLTHLSFKTDDTMNIGNKCCQEKSLDMNITMSNWSCWNLHMKSFFDLVSISVSSFFFFSFPQRGISFIHTEGMMPAIRSLIRSQLRVTHTASKHSAASGFELSDVLH